MADLLAQWLNDDIKLSKPIQNFEEDFSSGYLFGELLYKFNQQDNFGEFSTKDNITSKVKNFEKLEPTLRNLNIKFDSQSVDKIMKKERGYALRMLYQLKMILEKVYPPTDITILRKTGKNGDAQPALKLGSAKQSYKAMQSTFFKTRLQALNKPQKQSNMEKHLAKFQEEADRQYDEAQAANTAEREAGDVRKQEVRRAQINKLQRNAGFMEEWLQKGVEDWKQNMAYKKEREQSQLEFEYRQAQKMEEATNTRVDGATKEVEDGIAKFEASLRANGIQTEVTEDFAAANIAMDQTMKSKTTLRTQRMTQSLLSRPTMGIGGTMTKTGGLTLGSVGLRSKAKKPLDEKQRKDRERRRMRMIADQLGLMQDIERKRREEEVIERMQRQSKQEEELAYEAFRTGQCQRVIEENRSLREAKYSKRQELDVQNAAFKEQSMLDSMLDYMGREIDTLKERDDFLRTKDKEAKKLRQTTECQKMIDAIFDIANEAYIHLQKQDAGGIDDRNWHEWKQLFVEGVDIGAGAAVADAGSEAETAATAPLDRLEMVDYLENKGQWPVALVADNKPKLADILGGGEAAAAGGKPAKGKAAAPVEAAIDEADMVIDDAPANNYFVGDAVEQIISINHEARGRQLRPKNPHYLNLKLCLVGYAFAGKKYQAAELQKKYGLEVLHLTDLVEEAVKFFEANPNPIAREALELVDATKPSHETIHEESVEAEAAAEEKPAEDGAAQNAVEPPAAGQDEQPPAEEEKPKVLGLNPMFARAANVTQGDDEEVKSEASELEEELNPKEDFRACGEKIQEWLYAGGEIPDQLYVDLFIAKLRMTYEYKDRASLKGKLMQDARRELLLRRELAKLGAELGELKAALASKDAPKRKKKRTPEVVAKEIQDRKNELLGIMNVDNTGWILIDFPANFGQAMLLEKALSGYNIPADLKPTTREEEAKEAMLLVKPTEKPAPPKKLLPSGMDAVIWFDCKREECLRRALGRRVDPGTGMRYHIEDQPPSVDMSPLCEIIEPVDEQKESVACLLDRWVAFDQAASGLEKWLTQFGDEATKKDLMVRIDSGGKPDEVFSQIDGVLTDIINRKKKNQQMLRKTLQAEFVRQEELEAEQERQKAEAAEAARRRAEEAAAAAAEGDVAGEGAIQPGVSPRAVDHSVMASARSRQSMNDSIYTAVDVERPRDNIDNDFKGTLMALWKRTSTNYRNQLCLSLQKQRLQREEIQNYTHNVQAQFLKYLHRLDNKQEVLSNFIAEFNRFSDEQPDMREDEQTKEELHQRVDTLSDELWESAEERKEQAIEERKKIMESGWIESAQEHVTVIAQQMMQSEVDKFRGTVQLAWDYYHAIDEKLIPPAEDIPAVDILAQPEGAPPLELPPVESIDEAANPSDLESYAYPRLDELYKRAIKAQVVPDVTQLAAAQVDAKKAPKKGDKKGAPAGGEEEKEKESTYSKEMKEAIKIEKSILRYRLTQIRNWTLNRLKLQREQFLKIYKKLEDWIGVSNKAENDAIEEVCDVVKEAIEGHEKIANELRLRFMDFVVDESYQNYIDPPPPKLDAMEQIMSDRFAIPELKALIRELKTLAGANNAILNRGVVELLMTKTANAKSLGDAGGLPLDWAAFKRSDYERMVSNLDVNNEGSIDYRTLAVCLILLRSDLPSEKQLEELEVSLSKQQENFLAGAKLWCEATESSKDRDYSHEFDRIAMIKEIILSVFHDGNAENELNNTLSFITTIKEVIYNYQTQIQRKQTAINAALGPKLAAKQKPEAPGKRFIDVLLQQ